MKKLLILSFGIALLSIFACHKEKNIQKAECFDTTIEYFKNNGGLSIMTVSYTHLDVYKRQKPSWLNWSPRLKSVPNTFSPERWPNGASRDNRKLSLIHI